MWEPYFWTAVGLVLLMLGGDAVVRGAAGLAKKFGVSELLIGLVIVAFGTSAPELVVSIRSVLDGVPDVAVGNVIGSNIANILLVLGFGAIIAPIPMSQNVLFRDGVVVLAASGFLVWLGALGAIQFSAGVVLSSALAVYLVYSYATEQSPAARRERAPSEKTPRKEAFSEKVKRNRALLIAALDGNSLPVQMILLVIGFVALFFGAKWLIFGAVEIALGWGVSEAVIGVSIIAIGTSVPELAAVAVAALRKHPEVVLGSIVGSNIFNILAVLGITALIQPIEIAARFYDFDLWLMLAVVVIFLIFLSSDARLSRLEGSLMLIGYIAYILILFSGVLPEPFRERIGIP